jgi:LPS export ABC transporter protein LptC
MQVTAIFAAHKNDMFTVLYAGFFILFIFITSCGELDQNETQNVNRALSDSLLSTTETWNLDMQIIEDGQKKVRLQGRYAASYNNNEVNETRIRGPVTIHVFDTTTAIKTWVDSDSAIYRSEDSQFELFGDVRVRTREDKHLESEYLKWDEADNKISTPQFVIITTPSDSIAGTGFNGASDLSSYTIREPSGRVIFE